MKFSEAVTLLRRGYGGFSSPSSPQQPTPPKQSLRLRRLETTGYAAKENHDATLWKDSLTPKQGGHVLPIPRPAQGTVAHHGVGY